MQQAGIALVPDHRMENSLIGEWDLRENLALVHAEHGATGGVLSRRREEAEAARVMRLLNVKAHGSGQLLRTLFRRQQAEDLHRQVALRGGGPLQGHDLHRADRGRRHRRQAGDLRRDAAPRRRGHGDPHRLVRLLEIESVADRAIPFVDLAPGPELARNRFSEATFITAISGAAA
jgi:hypothetical protein